MSMFIDQCSLVCAHLAFVWWPEGLQVKNEDSTSQYEQVYSVRWFPVTPTLNIDILALFSQVSVVDIHVSSGYSWP